MITSMLYSLELTEIFGLLFIIASIVLISRHDYYSGFFANLQSDNPAIIIGAIISLLIGVILVATHGVYALQYRAYISGLSWVVLINGLLWLLMPEKMTRATKIIMSGRRYYIITLIFLIIGFILLYRGSQIYMIKECQIKGAACEKSVNVKQ
jgi:hypothetical protein